MVKNIVMCELVILNEVIVFFWFFILFYDDYILFG